MSYSTTYRSPSLDESTKPRDKNIARIGAVIITALVILIIFWRFFSRLDPKPEAGGVMASFGNVAIAGSGSAENDSDNPKTNPTIYGKLQYGKIQYIGNSPGPQNGPKKLKSMSKQG